MDPASREYGYRVETSSDSNNSPKEVPMRKRTIFRGAVLFPLFLAFIVVLCMLAAAFVVVLYHGRPVLPTENTVRQPHALLAIISSATNIALGGLISSGAAMVWWRSLQRGTTLKRMHYVWERGKGPGLFSGLAAAFDSRKVVIVASVVAAAQFGSNPLLQRALRVGPAEPHDVNIKMDLPKTMPDGLMGTRTGGVGTLNQSITLSTQAVDALADWFRNSPLENVSWNITSTETIDQSERSCPSSSTCHTTVEGPGIHAVCWNSTMTIDLGASQLPGVTIFETNLTYNSQANSSDPDLAQPSLTLTALYLVDSSPTCRGNIVVETCTILSATVLYPLTIIDTTIHLDLSDTTLAPWESDYYATGDVPIVPQNGQSGHLLGLLGDVGYAFTSRVQHGIGRSTNTTPTSEEDTSVTATIRNWISQLFITPPTEPSTSACSLQFRRPTPFLLSALQSIGLRTAFKSDSRFTQTVPTTANPSSGSLSYLRSLPFLISSLALLLVALLSSLSLLYGFWSLPRPDLSLSPLTILAAGQSPLLIPTHDTSSPSPNNTQALLARFGHLPVRYHHGRIISIDSPAPHSAPLFLPRPPAPTPVSMETPTRPLSAPPVRHRSRQGSAASAPPRLPAVRIDPEGLGIIDPRLRGSDPGSQAGASQHQQQQQQHRRQRSHPVLGVAGPSGASTSIAAGLYQQQQQHRRQRSHPVLGVAGPSGAATSIAAGLYQQPRTVHQRHRSIPGPSVRRPSTSNLRIVSTLGVPEQDGLPPLPRSPDPPRVPPKDSSPGAIERPGNPVGRMIEGERGDLGNENSAVSEGGDGLGDLEMGLGR